MYIDEVLQVFLTLQVNTDVFSDPTAYTIRSNESLALYEYIFTRFSLCLNKYTIFSNFMRLVIGVESDFSWLGIVHQYLSQHLVKLVLRIVARKSCCETSLEIIYAFWSQMVYTSERFVQDTSRIVI